MAPVPQALQGEILNQELIPKRAKNNETEKIYREIHIKLNYVWLYVLEKLIWNYGAAFFSLSQNCQVNMGLAVCGWFGIQITPTCLAAASEFSDFVQISDRSPAQGSSQQDALESIRISFEFASILSPKHLFVPKAALLS